MNYEVSEMDISGATLEPNIINNPEAKEVIEEERNSKIDPLSLSKQTGFENTSTNIPHQSSSSKRVLNLEHESSIKRLPHRHNRGIHKTTYELELSIKVRYPTSNYFPNHCLSESNKSFVNKLSIVVIPNIV